MNTVRQYAKIAHDDIEIRKHCKHYFTVECTTSYCVIISIIMCCALADDRSVNMANYAWGNPSIILKQT